MFEALFLIAISFNGIVFTDQEVRENLLRETREVLASEPCGLAFKNAYGVDPLKMLDDVTVWPQNTIDSGVLGYVVCERGPIIYMDFSLLRPRNNEKFTHVMIHELSHLADCHRQTWRECAAEEGDLFERICMGNSLRYDKAPRWWWKRYVRRSGNKISLSVVLPNDGR